MSPPYFDFLLKMNTQFDIFSVRILTKENLEFRIHNNLYRACVVRDVDS